MTEMRWGRKVGDIEREGEGREKMKQRGTKARRIKKDKTERCSEDGKQRIRDERGEEEGEREMVYNE